MRAIVDTIKVCRLTGRRQDELELHKINLKLRRKLLGKRHPTTMVATAELGRCLQQLGDEACGREVMMQAKRLAQAHLDSNHPFKMRIYIIMTALHD